VAWLVLLVAIVAPLVAAGAIVVSARTDIVAELPPTWVKTEDAEGGIEVPAALVLDFSEQQPAPAPAWTGVVEEVLVVPGDHVATGTPVARLGGALRLASSVGTPIGRVLQRGDAGRDVASLNQTLGALGLPASPGEVFGARTELGVRRLSRQLTGVETSAFDPGWVVFLPDGGGVVGQVNLRVGQPAPASGSPVFGLEPELKGARAVSPDDIPEGPVGSAGAAGISTGREEVSVESVESTLVVPAGAAFVVDGEEMPLLEGGRLAPEFFRAASTVARGGTVISGVVRRPIPPGTARIPTGAVFSSSTGTTCARIRDGRRVDTVRVELVDSYLGSTLAAGLPPNVEVEVSPPVEVRRKCR